KDSKIPQNENLKNWQKLSIKRALKDAVDNNSDYFAWTTGEQQSARYDLAKEVDVIKWGKSTDKTGKISVTVEPKQGSPIGFQFDDKGVITKSYENAESLVGKNLSEAVGKGIAEKMVAKSSGELKGEGLNIGGEWAKNLYDKQVKNIVEDLTGGKVEMIDLGLSVDKIKSFDLLKDGSGERIGKLTPNNIKVGKIISDSNGRYFIVTDVLGDGKFKAVPRIRMGDWDIQGLINNELEKVEIERLNEYKQIFDISQKTTQQQAIKLTPEIKAIIRGETPKLKKSISSLPSKTEDGKTLNLE
ncbi:hypothetical protein KBB74_02905, partial [Candidatus Parcubacteria bacterium]|nr:hypothetical protein [Candidatus Parcubacteria bacterium]